MVCILMDYISQTIGSYVLVYHLARHGQDPLDVTVLRRLLPPMVESVITRIYNDLSPKYKNMP